MKYRKFGNTGVIISALGFGAMRLPEYEKNGNRMVDEDKSIEIIHRAFDLGVNYIDTAYGYCGKMSEIVVGKAIKGYRNKVYVSTKSPLWDIKEKSDYRRILEEQLKKLDVDYIDFYHFHSVNKDKWENLVLKFDLLEDAQKAKEEGIIKHISFSFHDKPEVMIELIDTGIFETLLCQYNLLDRANEHAIAYAREKGLGVVIMGPVGGGRLASPSEVIRQSLGGKAGSTPEVALRFVLANPNVCCALSGMNTLEMVEENARVASIEEPLSEEDIRRINETFEENKRLAELYCTGCEYCLPCPRGIKIPRVFNIMNYHRVYGLTDYAKSQFKGIGTDENHGASPADCIECGAGEEKCPQNIKIREKLKEALAELE
ncbi:MAG: aldo/keto reductase [Clostridiaceae bacterium]|nr:aldo/keto reductase [Clostridiaceae bacterium]